jgi:phenylpropionate dioxygenase-like ring-hydroxylating dioxygenase large terminal subunit
MSHSLLPQYWYIVAESCEVTQDNIIARQVLDEWLACYRDKSGQVVVAQDRCIHRCVRLSQGHIQQGALTCAYHGWVYGEAGRVTSIPVDGGEGSFPKALQAKTYLTEEQDGYVYVCLSPGVQTPSFPRLTPKTGVSGQHSIRLQNRFLNTLANCVENYIDVPHTAYVHHGIFRKPKGKALKITLLRQQGEIHITYHGESMNLGSFSWFLNAQGKDIKHTDHFYAPNMTHVHYQLPNGYYYVITSQCIPVSRFETLVYTDITYYFGIWTPWLAWLVRRQAQKVIDQDIMILNQQGEVIQKYGAYFYPTTSDTIHTLTHELIEAMEHGIAPSECSDENLEACFYV